MNNLIRKDIFIAVTELGLMPTQIKNNEKTIAKMLLIYNQNKNKNKKQEENKIDNLMRKDFFIAMAELGLTPTQIKKIKKTVPKMLSMYITKLKNKK